MQDRFVRGFIAGLLGAFVMAAINIPAYMTGITISRSLDIAAMLMWGYTPTATWETVFAWLVVAGYSAILGIVFAYLLPMLTSRYHIFKGAIFGIAVWFLSYAIGSLYKVPLMEKSTPMTLLVQLIGAAGYGIVVASYLAWADNRVGAGEGKKKPLLARTVPEPAFKPTEKDSSQQNDHKQDNRRIKE